MATLRQYSQAGQVDDEFCSKYGFLIPSVKMAYKKNVAQVGSEMTRGGNVL